jgi:hypothetical protein
LVTLVVSCSPAYVVYCIGGYCIGENSAKVLAETESPLAAPAVLKVLL